MTAPPVLHLQLTSMRYGDTPCLGPIDIAIDHGQTVAITGPSGIGKTTLLRIVAGLETRFDGARQMGGKLAFVFQEPTLLRWRTALENITLATRVSPDIARQALAEVGLADMAARYPDQLSLGQQRRLSLARAFAADPDLLLMDEPFVSLDAALADEMMALFATLRARRDTATLLVTHAMDEAEKLATRILRLDGRPATIAEERQNEGAYFQLSASGVTSSRS